MTERTIKPTTETAGALDPMDQVIGKFVESLEKPERRSELSMLAFKDRLRLAEVGLDVEEHLARVINYDKAPIDRPRQIRALSDLRIAENELGATNALVRDRFDSIPGYTAQSNHWESQLQLAIFIVGDTKRAELYGRLRSVILTVETPQE